MSISSYFNHTSKYTLQNYNHMQIICMAVVQMYWNYTWVRLMTNESFCVKHVEVRNKTWRCACRKINNLTTSKFPTPTCSEVFFPLILQQHARLVNILVKWCAVHTKILIIIHLTAVSRICLSSVTQYKFMKVWVWSSKSWPLLTLKIFFWAGQIFAWVSPNERKLSSTGKSPAPLTGPAHSTSWVCFQPSNMSHRAETQSGETEAKGRSLSRSC